ncbi:SEL1-like repeat protein [Rhizobium sp. FY34]|uniref:SEL1-like repeat protein n=1 Tax=Rhizobium sp. FY34 TaxID=2562309 RepID=UPI0010C00327|nr:SEL1-like repeat protein [Rhizobium sp. FY34]
MNGSRLTSHPRGENSSLDALNRTIEGLEARIAGLLKTSGRGTGATGPSVAASASASASEPYRAPPENPRSPRIDIDMLNEIRQRQRILDASRDREGRRERGPKAGHAAARQPDLPAPAPAARPQPTAEAPPRANSRPLANTDIKANTDIQDMAQALHSLRRELKQDISDSIAREMSTLRGDVQALRHSSADTYFGDDLREDLGRLAHGVDVLSQRTPSGALELRGELEDLRRLIDGLATEQSVQRMESRWTALEDRIEDIDTGSIQKELIALAYRIDGIKAELGTMADSPAIRALEDKVLMMATAMEELIARPNETQTFNDQFSQLDERLDEISRAVAISRSPRADAEEQAMLRRMEERLALLADRMDSLAHVQDAQRLEDRLDELAETMKHGPQGDLTGYISDLSRKIDALALEQTSDGLADRLDDLTRRIDDMGRHSDLQDEAGLERLEVRLDAIAARLDEATSGPVGDNQAIINLEKQIAHLSSLLSEPQHEGAALVTHFDERMSALEGYMATSDEYILEAARQAAETVIEAYARNGTASAASPGDTAAIIGLAEDLRHLEQLARSSEERTHQTFEALHRTLVQIASRLDTMEDRLAAPPSSLMNHAVIERNQAALRKQDIAREPAHLDQAFLEPAKRDRAVASDEIRPPFAAAPIAGPTEEKRAAERSVLARTTDDLMNDAASGIDLSDVSQPDEAAEPVASRTGLLAGLTKRLMPGKTGTKAKATKPAASTKAEQKKQKRAVIDPAPSLDPGDLADGHENDLLEPGSGTPDLRKILERVRATQAASGSTPAMDGERIDYIAAARRAATAAAQETDPMQVAAKPKQQRIKAKVDAGGLKGLLARHRRPILMAVGAILLALMAMPLVSTLTRSEKAPTPTVAITSEQTSQSQPAAMTPPARNDAAQVQASSAQQAHANLMAPAQDVQTLQQPGQPADATVTAAPLGAPQTDATVAPAAAAATPRITVPETIGPKSLADAAANGDPQALFEIGARFTEGRNGVATDLPEAARWYAMAAEQGFAPAQYRLGSLYEKGTGIGRDIKKAMALYEQAAAAGNASSMHNLAVLYASGAAGAANYKAAVDWFTKAANLGIVDSQFNLAILHARGNGTPQNLEESYKWFAIAAKGGDKDAGQKRDEVANALKPERLEAARIAVDMWKPQAVNERSNSVSVPDEWVGKGVTTASVDMEKAIRNIQAILNRNGYDAGQADGMMGKKTVTAIKSFQRANGLAEDGTISEPLVRKLLEKNETKGA